MKVGDEMSKKKRLGNKSVETAAPGAQPEAAKSQPKLTREDYLEVKTLHTDKQILLSRREILVLQDQSIQAEMARLDSRHVALKLIIEKRYGIDDVEKYRILADGSLEPLGDRKG